MLVGLSKPQLLAPTTWLLSPAASRKEGAQILFDKHTVDFLLGLLASLGLRRVLCLGVPRVHEAIQKARWRAGPATAGEDQRRPSPDMTTSYLLDLDERFAQFYGADRFCRYNMFNGHVFDTDAAVHMAEFVRRADCILVDPPYGGSPVALAATLRRLWKLAAADGGKNDGREGEDGTSGEKRWGADSACRLGPSALACGNKELPTFFFFPYFLEVGVYERPDRRMHTTVASGHLCCLRT